MEHRIIYQNAFYQVMVNERNRLSLKNLKGGAAALPVTCDHKVLLMKIYRSAIRQVSLEIPRGFAEAGESSRETAERELQEEISCTGAPYIFLGSFFTDTGLIDNKTDLFLVRNAHVEGKLQQEEGISELLYVDFMDAWKMAEEGEISDSFTIAALMKSRKYLLDR